MQQEIAVREYRPGDVQDLANIYYNTIHQINIQHYTQEQVDVWAPRTSLDCVGWSKKFARTKPFVAVADGKVVGFAEFEPDGHVDCFYCHHEWIGQGVGSALMNKIHEEAIQHHITRIFSEVSITAKHFFENKGFRIISQQTITRNDIDLTNYKMEKVLTDV